MKSYSFILSILLYCFLFSSVSAYERLKLATTTSTANSGLLNYLNPIFKEKSGVRVDAIAVGTGKALKLGQNGDVDVMLVHAREAEERALLLLGNVCWVVYVQSGSWRAVRTLGRGRRALATAASPPPDVQTYRTSCRSTW